MNPCPTVKLKQRRHDRKWPAALHEEKALPSLQRSAQDLDGQRFTVLVDDAEMHVGLHAASRGWHTSLTAIAQPRRDPCGSGVRRIARHGSSVRAPRATRREPARAR